MNIQNELLNLIADDLNISNTMFDKATESYEAVANWLKGHNILQGDLNFYPQGSFSIGTVVKPLKDNDEEYDIDLVFEISEMNLTPKELKYLVGKRLKENETYNKLLDEEGRRCWSLQYSGFHMDILPSITCEGDVPNTIKITHTDDYINYIYKESNPKGYRNWFNDINKEDQIFLKNAYSRKHQVKIEEVPNHKISTNLQKIIRILKRHRDIMYKGKENAPISIIITTLAAKAYNNQDNLISSLTHTLLNMEKFIEKNEGEYIIQNPVNNEENFADKWAENPKKKDEFFKWLNQAKTDLVDVPMSLIGVDDIADHFKRVLGEKTTIRSVTEYAREFKLLRESGKLFYDGKTAAVTKRETKKIVKDHSFYGY